MALAHEKVGHTSQGLWHHKGMQLPAYVQHVANDLISERGIPESMAVHMAIGLIHDWARGGGDVKPDTRAKAVAALAEWEKLRAQAHAMTSAKRAEMTETADRAAMATADINNLPDSDFAFIEPGGQKDSSGKTVPRSLRHFPVHDAAHIRNALARLPQSGLSDAQKATALKKIRAAADKAGVEAGGGDGNGQAASRTSPGEILRFYPLEDIHILSRAEGDGSGTMVEAYATVFDAPAEIHDHQGHYNEVIDRGAFDDVLSRIRRSRGGLAGAVKVLYNHGMTAQNTPAPEYQIPLGVPVDIVPEKRGLLTRTRYDAGDPFTDRILAKIRSGSITAQSFVGGIIRSDPSLMGPGDRYRKRGGTLTTVRRMQLGLREYGPVLWPAYSGAEILGVRMQLPGDDLEEQRSAPDTPEGEEYSSDMEEPVAGGVPGEAHSSRYHQHALYALRFREMLEQKGLAL
jgi:HK97 family phage prohead protease